MVPMRTNAIVIDDEQDIVEVISEYLNFKGIEVKGTGFNGKEAVELYKKFNPDIVLMDVMMPEYSGFYGLQNIRHIDPEAKIIMVTADNSKKTYEKLKKLEASAILHKPYKIETVLETIEQIKSKITIKNKTK
jgi:DNA-binding response OmpR family regulator